MRRALVLLLVLLPLAAEAAPALRAKGKKAPKVEEVKKVRPAPPTPMAAQGPLAELSETLGSLTRLAEVCTPEAKPNPWRARMEGLIEAEGEAAQAKTQMQGAFNRGYAEFANAYARCTPAALAAEQAQRREAARQAQAISQRFGN